MTNNNAVQNDAKSDPIVSWTQTGNTIDILSASGKVLRLSVLTPDIVRVQVAQAGDFAESLAMRWGFVREQWPPVALKVEDSDAAVTIRTSSLAASVDRRTMTVTFVDAAGRTITSQVASITLGPTPQISHVLAEDEHIYGFGFQRKSLDARGQKLLWARRFRHQEATAPFFMSSRGYGFYSNNTWEHTFDFSQPDSGAYTVRARRWPARLLHYPRAVVP